MKPLVQLKKATLLILISFVFACFALSQTVRAQLNPPPDGGYDGGNTAEGANALFNLSTGVTNTALGFQALYSNTTGSTNTATGYQALVFNTTGGDNTANGVQALYSNTTGSFNSAYGFQALYSNTTGIQNTANGVQALYTNTTGNQNTANGASALLLNTTGGDNTANGVNALVNNTTGHDNTADGWQALAVNTTGANNTATGAGALFGNTTGNNNIALGINAGQNLTAGDNNIDIGNQGVAAEASTIRIGTMGTQTATYIAGIMGKVVPKGIPVIINANGQLGTVTSSARFKKEIKPMDKASEAILALNPVTFHYKSDSTRTPQFGLIAEEVNKVNPDLVVRDEKGEIYTVRYDAVNAMLLNEFLKEHGKVEAQEATITQLKSTVAQQQKDFQAIAVNQQKQIEALRAGLQKVSAQIEVNKPAPQTVSNNQ